MATALAFLKTAALFYLGNKIVCIHLGTRIVMPMRLSNTKCQTKKTTPNKTAVCPQTPFVFLLEKSSKIASTYLFFKFLGNEIALYL